MKNLIKSIILIAIFAFSFNSCFSVQTFDDKKKEIIALYNSNSLDEAYQMISAVPEDERDAELWFLLGNLTQDFNNDVNAAFFLQKAAILDPKFDKAHYNLANIYLKHQFPRHHYTSVLIFEHFFHLNLFLKINQLFVL